MWLMCTQKTGLSAKGLDRESGLGSYKTAWLMLQKLRQAIVRIGRDTLSGTVEVDETYLGGEKSGVAGRQLVGKALVAIAVELEGKRVGRIRLRDVADASGRSLVGFIAECVAKGSRVHTDDWNGYNSVQEAGYVHWVTPVLGDQKRALKHLPHVHLIASLIKRCLGATHQGRVSGKHLQRYLDEYAFRFNRRRSEHVGKLFHRLVEQLVLRQAETYLTFLKCQVIVDLRKWQ
jgi:transposase-like protein